MSNTATTAPALKTICVKPAPVRLDPKAVTEAILTAEGETQAVERIYRMVYPEFDRIKSVDGHPVCNKETWKLICRPMMDLTKRLNRARHQMKQVLPGGAWMNWGFSQPTDELEASGLLKDWQVIPAAVTI